MDSTRPLPGKEDSLKRHGLTKVSLPANRLEAVAVEPVAPRYVPGGLVSRVVFSSAFAVAYGVTLPVYFVTGLLPRQNAIGKGFEDGAQAARMQLDQAAQRRAHERAERQAELAAQGKEEALIEESAYTLAAII